MRENLEDLYYKLLDILKLPARTYRYITRFLYYGYWGAKYSRDYDAGSGYSLLYAHIKRVRAFMDSGNTHLLWNSQDKPKGLIRKLYELEELLSRYHRYELETYQFSSGYFITLEDLENGNKRTDTEIQLLRRLLKKDRTINRQNKERLDLLISKYMPGFWD